MAPDFDRLATDDWTLIRDFLSTEEVRALQTYWEKSATAARPARVSANVSLNTEIRGDQILWLNENEDPAVDALFVRLHQLRRELSEALFLNLHDFEAHLACYPPGARYQAHIDQPRKNGQAEGRRLISLVLYLNSNWRPEDGGELILWAEDGQSERARIAPVAGTAALFRSDTVLHEVSEAHAPRLSIAVWFRRSPTTGIF